VTEVLPQKDTGILRSSSLLSGVKTQAVASAVAERLLRRPRERHVFTDLQFTTEVEESEFAGKSLVRSTSFAPVVYIDLENGDRVVTTSEKFFDPKRYRKLTGDSIEELEREDTIRADQKPMGGGNSPEKKQATLTSKLTRQSLLVDGHKPDSRWLENLLELSYEIGTGLYVWRYLLKCLMLVSLDDVNRAQITRTLQVSMPFFTGYEAFILDNLIGALDKGDKGTVGFWLKIGLRNRNVSRTIVQQAGPRWDFLWHLAHQFKRNRWYDGWGQLPIPLVGITGFPTTENFASSRALVLASFFRVTLGSGHYWTRLLTGRESLVTDDPNAAAQNLAAESNGFESANRNQHGTTLGRAKTNAFRLQHRLPTDESIVRSFVNDPFSTMLNNGAEHSLRQVGRHFRNMLNQPDGNFAHQLMEQMNPFEFLRFHMPIVLLALTSLRGISSWDAEVLAPIVHKMQRIRQVDTVAPIREIVDELLNSIVVGVCGGVSGRVNALESVLKAINDALVVCEEEAAKVHKILNSAQIGLIAGTELLNSHSWYVPEDSVLRQACLDTCCGRQPEIEEVTVRRALSLLTPRDKRTLIELCQQGQHGTRPGRLLLIRAATLLKREIRRDGLDKQLRTMSRGVEVTVFTPDKSYWLVGDNGTERVYRYKGKKSNRQVHIFVDRQSNAELELDHHAPNELVVEYVEVAEVITRAQKAFMTIELNHGKKFSYNCWMEFAYMREPLRKLLTLAQTHCSELDDARLNVLSHFQMRAQTEVSLHNLNEGQTYYVYEHGAYRPFTYSPNKYVPGSEEHQAIKHHKIVSVPPQSLIIVGGGPTGLLTAVHCLESVLVSDGNLRLYESRDSFQQAGARFERAQVVRLDARWIAMLRYHLGSLFEDIWVPASGETDPHLGNTLPAQNFIEITIKDMESALNVQMVKLASRGLVQHDTNAGAQYDVKSNTLSKKGGALKLNDLVLRKVSPAGEPSLSDYSWKVAALNLAETLSPADLVLGEEYAVYVPSERQVYPFKLVSVDLALHAYSFDPTRTDSGLEPISAVAEDLPYVYAKGVKAHGEVESLMFESVLRQDRGKHCRQTMGFGELEKQVFQLDTGHCHVAEAIGKPTGSNVHFQMTNYEPYGVACLYGLKVSLGMHNFGTGRFHRGVWDDIRSHTEQNTRVIGDFTKIVNATLITKGMYDHLTEDPNWKLHWEKLVADLGFGEELGNIFKLMSIFVEELRDMAPYQRTHLQTRFFETGDNFYLGMEFTREYDEWKGRTVQALTSTVVSKQLTITDTAERAKASRSLRALTGALTHNIDRLWYDSCLEVIRKGDVYNPGGQGTIPRLYLIDALVEQPLGSLIVGEAFRTVAQPLLRYEVLVTEKVHTYCLVRDIEGHVSRMPKSTPIRRGGNLTRNPSGNAESKVSIATFPVAHYVNHRTMRMNNSKRGYVFCFLGDEQSTPHFMRYSGLTGGAINGMLLNNFITDAVSGIDFAARFKQYSATTNWSNGEVVTRGTGANYGEDGFLRPAFPYKEGVRFLHSKVIEYHETDQDLTQTNYGVGFSGKNGAKGSQGLSYDWSVKFAAALIPRGMEHNSAFVQAMLQQVQKVTIEYFVDLVVLDTVVQVTPEALRARAAEMERVAATKDGGLQGNLFFDNPDTFWAGYLDALVASVEDKQRLEQKHVRVIKSVSSTIAHVVEFAKKLYDENQRISTQGVLQHKASDCLIDSFAVEAQDFANSLAMSAALTATSVAVGSSSRVTDFDFTDNGLPFAIVLGFFIPFVAVGTIANAARYKNRNEEWRVQYVDHKYADILKGIYALMLPADRKALPAEQDPFLAVLEAKKAKFIKDVKYYNYPEPKEFKVAVDKLIAHMHETHAIKEFMHLLTTKFLPETYSTNGYLSQGLVGFYMSCEELLRFTTDVSAGQRPSLEAASSLFERYRLFQRPLAQSLERGTIKFGFFKKRSIKQNHFVTLFLYFWNLLWCTKTRRGGGCCALPQTAKQAHHDATACSYIKPMAATTKELVAQMRNLQSQVPAPSMQRETLETESLYHATNESYISSFIIAVPGYLTFWAFILFTIANIAVVADNEEPTCGGGLCGPGPQWALNLQRGNTWFTGFVSPVPAILAAVFLTRKLLFQTGCISAVKGHLRNSRNSASAQKMQQVVRIGRAQQLVTFFRALSAYAAAVALPWNWVVAEQDLLGLDLSELLSDLPFYLAAGSAGLQLVMLLFRYVVEYSILWSVDTKLGEYVTDCFADELAELKKKLSAPMNSVETVHVQEARAWEYVARAFLHKYRFDTIFRANRMGNIMHHIMSGPASAKVSNIVQQSA